MPGLRGDTAFCSQIHPGRPGSMKTLLGPLSPSSGHHGILLIYLLKHLLYLFESEHLSADSIFIVMMV